MLTQLVCIAVVVDPTDQIADITDDPADNRVLEAAAEGDAEVIVSGDRHLLTLGAWRGIRVLTPAAVRAPMDQLRPPDRLSTHREPNVLLAGQRPRRP